MLNCMRDIMWNGRLMEARGSCSRARDGHLIVIDVSEERKAPRAVEWDVPPETRRGALKAPRTLKFAARHSVGSSGAEFEGDEPLRVELSWKEDVKITFLSSCTISSTLHLICPPPPPVPHDQYRNCFDWAISFSPPDSSLYCSIGVSVGCSDSQRRQTCKHRNFPGACMWSGTPCASVGGQSSGARDRRAPLAN